MDARNEAPGTNHARPAERGRAGERIRERWGFGRLALRVGAIGLCAAAMAVGAATAGAQGPTAAFYPPELHNGFFGTEMAISGQNVVISAPQYVDGGTTTGIAYVYQIGNALPVHILRNPSPTTLPNDPLAAVGDYFGGAVAIDGNLIVVTAPLSDDGGTTNTGIAHLFNAADGSLERTIHNPGGGVDRFGGAAAISGNKILMGAPHTNDGALEAGIAYLYDAENGALLQTFHNPSPETYDFFGSSVAITGNDAFIGAWHDADGGSVYLFDATTGQLMRTFNNPTGGSRDQFGFSVAVSGTRLLVGNPVHFTSETNHEGQGYLFDIATGTLLQRYCKRTSVKS